MTPVIIDCDPGIDDAVALLLAAASPELELLAVTTVAGNRPLAITSPNACRVLDLAGRHDVAVHAGCARSLVGGAERSAQVHGSNGLGDVELPVLRETSAPAAWDMLAATLRERAPHTVTLLAVGPLTNLALVEIMHPGLLQRAKAVLVMGGAAFCAGNVTPSAEFNFYADALAAHVVLSAGADLKLFGLDVTRKAIATRDWIASMHALGTRCGRAASAMLSSSSASRDPLLHDACPVAYLVAPELFAGETCSVSVDWRPGPTEGHVSAWRATRDDKPFAPNALVFTDVDHARLLALMRERIARLP